MIEKKWKQHNVVFSIVLRKQELKFQFRVPSVKILKYYWLKWIVWTCQNKWQCSYVSICRNRSKLRNGWLFGLKIWCKILLEYSEPKRKSKQNNFYGTDMTNWRMQEIQHETKTKQTNNIKTSRQICAGEAQCRMEGDDHDEDGRIRENKWLNVLDKSSI